jgi:DNA polymerase-3 subunit delta'
MQMLVNYPWLQQAKQQLLDIARHNSQALLLHGSQGIGKKSLSLWLAKILLCENIITNNSCNHCQSCHLFDIFQHPDLHILDYTDEKSTESNSNSSSTSNNTIGIDKIHHLIEQLQQTPHMGKRQVVVIYTIEKLTIPASNALLKTLEEPNNTTTFILVSHNRKQVLATILSRCISMNIPQPSTEQGNEWIKQNNHNMPSAIMHLFAHKPLMTRNYDENIYNNTIQFLIKPNINELKIDSKKTQQLEQILNICSYWVFDLLYYIYSGKTKYFKEISSLKIDINKISVDNVYTCWNQLTDIYKHSNANINQKLVLSMFVYAYQDIFKY